jgi:hypothetical protein
MRAPNRCLGGLESREACGLEREALGWYVTAVTCAWHLSSRLGDSRSRACSHYINTAGWSIARKQGRTASRYNASFSNECSHEIHFVLIYTNIVKPWYQFALSLPWSLSSSSSTVSSDGYPSIRANQYTTYFRRY